jgi:hypothetical protein
MSIVSVFLLNKKVFEKFEDEGVLKPMNVLYIHMEV